MQSHRWLAVGAHLALTTLIVSALASSPDAGAAALDGKKIFTDKGCFACHGLGGPSPGPGPELTQVAYPACGSNTFVDRGSGGLRYALTKR